MARVVAIQFNNVGKIYDFNAGDMDLKQGDRVVVDTERGAGMGTVVTPPVEKADSLVHHPLAMVRRLMGPEDQAVLDLHAQKEKEAREYCLRRIKERGMDMKLVKVEYLFDGSKAIFYFTADGRIDFRELVKDLAHTFHNRIEMRQIGVRDEAKMVGGLGVCGRELCCSSFLRDFQPVSVKMAKEQNLALNPNKISGQCGRLLCCLDYEYEAYCELRKNFPKCGKKACTKSGCGVVEKMNLLTGEMALRQEDGKLLSAHVSELMDETQYNSKGSVSEHQQQRKQQEKSVEKAVKPDVEENNCSTEITSTGEQQSPTAEKQPAGQQKSKRKRNRRHGHRKNSGNKPGSTSQEQ